MGLNPLIPSVLLLITPFLFTAAASHGPHHGHEWVVEVADGTTTEDVRAVLEGGSGAGGAMLVKKLRGLDNRYVIRTHPGSRWRRSAGFENFQNPGPLPIFKTGQLRPHPILSVHPQRHLLRTKRSIVPPLDSTPLPVFNDPLWDEQWQLHERFTLSHLSSQPIRADHRITDVWQRLNLTGRGVVVTIVDDGIDHRHGDLAANYDPLASYDFNDDDADPMPGPGEVNSHGTRCAGLVAMVGNNSLCGVGVAHNARIGAIRLLDGHLTDR